MHSNEMTASKSARLSTARSEHFYVVYVTCARLRQFTCLSVTCRSYERQAQESQRKSDASNQIPVTPIFILDNDASLDEIPTRDRSKRINPAAANSGF